MTENEILACHGTLQNLLNYQCQFELKKREMMLFVKLCDLLEKRCDLLLLHYETEIDRIKNDKKTP